MVSVKILNDIYSRLGVVNCFIKHNVFISERKVEEYIMHYREKILEYLRKPDKRIRDIHRFDMVSTAAHYIPDYLQNETFIECIEIYIGKGNYICFYEPYLANDLSEVPLND